MISIYKTFGEPGQRTLKRIDEPEPECWIKMTLPDWDECKKISARYDIDITDLRAALDEEEYSRFTFEDGYDLLIIDVPMRETRNDRLTYTTIPLGVILLPEAIITICGHQTDVISQFVADKVRDFNTSHKRRFTYQIMYAICIEYQRMLRQIDRRRVEIERLVSDGDLEDAELMDLHELESSLVYFDTSLRSNQNILRKMIRVERLRHPEKNILNEKNQELLDDIEIETNQAIEMTAIYRNIIENTSTLLATQINNQLNDVMKLLTSVTLVLSIPTIIGGIWGMNVAVPFANTPAGFAIITVIMVIACGAALWVLHKKNML
jgi:magnesium transporter